MPDNNEKVIFGAEFESKGVQEGVEETLKSFQELKEGVVELKEETKAMKKELAENEKQMEKLGKAAKTALNKDVIEQYNRQIDNLKTKNNSLTESISKNTKATEIGTIAIKSFNKEQRETQKNHELVGKAVEKFTNVNHLASEGIGRLRSKVVDAGLALVSGFAGGIVASVLPALFEMVSGLFEAKKKLDEFAKEKKVFTELFETASKSVAAETVRLDVYKQKLNDTNIPAADRVKIAKEYNKTADETNKIDLKQIDNLQLINEKIEAQNQLILKRALSTAALSKLTESATLLIASQLELDAALKRSGTTEQQVTDAVEASGKRRIDITTKQTQSLDGFNNTLSKNLNIQEKASSATSAFVTKDVASLNFLINRRNSFKKELEETTQLLSPFITVDGLTTKDPKTRDTRQIENVFEQKLAELKARLAAVTEKVFTNENSIQKKFAAQLEKEFVGIEKLLKDKKLTANQADILKALLVDINSVELEKNLEEFSKKRLAALQKINDEISAASFAYEEKRIANIKDDFEREAAAIEEGNKKAVEAIEKQRLALIAQIKKDTDEGLISPETAKRKKFLTNFIFGGLLDEVEQAKLEKQAALAFAKFQRVIDGVKKQGESDTLILSESTTAEIQKQTEFYLKGEITYDRYQKKLTEILKKEANERRKILLKAQEEELKLVNDKIVSSTDQKEVEALQKQQAALRASIAQLKREVAEGGAKDDKEGEQKRIDKILNYVKAVQELATAILSFWQQVNAAEAAALDRSIALQNKRVENARLIADKGNAEYLEMEQKRLDELQRKREENARKQLAINNALTLSNAIVAAVTAIAQAVSTGSPFAAIAAVASVIGAIGAAYSFVNSLQPQSASFFEGTEYVQGAGRPLGKDTVPANLHIGERVVRAKDNKDYYDALSAVHNHTIPADVLNDFVNSYPNNSVPIVDLDRLASATGNKLGADSSEVLAKFDSLNEKMEDVVRAVAGIGVNVNMDEDGFSASIETHLSRKRLNKRS